MSPSSSTSTPAPMQSVDTARVNSLEARMDEQSAQIASLAQGMHEMLQQMRQLHCDTMAASSATRSTIVQLTHPRLQSIGLPGQTGLENRPIHPRWRLARHQKSRRRWHSRLRPPMGEAEGLRLMPEIHLALSKLERQ
eukprot:1977755-Pleurochrysis_carterae.AAC.1